MQPYEHLFRRTSFRPPMMERHFGENRHLGHRRSAGIFLAELLQPGPITINPGKRWKSASIDLGIFSSSPTSAGC
jgi:hypothetical protein